jgi:endonuclease YncB( thermonuclease family)
MRNCLKIFLLLTFLPFGLYSQTFQVKVTGISDGDTFTGLNSDNLQLKFRIHGIDAPEKKQAFGKKAREHLGSLIFKQNVTVHVNDRDRWDRYIARVATDDGKDVGKEMIQAGLAWHYKHFDNILIKI